MQKDSVPGAATTPSTGNEAAKNKWRKRAITAAALAIVFLLGVSVGGGALRFTPDANRANASLPEDLDYSSVEQLYDLLKANYDGSLDQDALLDGLKSGLAAATGDPYTQYLSQEEAKEFDEQLNGSFSGIGAELGKDEDGNIIIVSPIEGFPADKAGLRPQDIILSINDENASGLEIDEAVSKIRGEVGTKVTLRILRGSEDLRLTITRAQIDIPSVEWEFLDGKVGYIQISTFGEDTTRLTRQAVKELKGQGAEKILLDLRGNPGGLLSSAIEISSLWLPEGKTVLQEKRGGVLVETFRSQPEGGGKPALQGMPTVVLLNAGSASASEIVAGALRDNNAARIFGEKSYGKGSVQELRPLPTGAEVKITSARWQRPNGQNIDKKGIKPDTEVKMTDEDYEAERDPQKDQALEYLRKN